MTPRHTLHYVAPHLAEGLHGGRHVEAGDADAQGAAARRHLSRRQRRQLSDGRVEVLGEIGVVEGAVVQGGQGGDVLLARCGCRGSNSK